MGSGAFNSVGGDVAEMPHLKRQLHEAERRRDAAVESERLSEFARASKRGGPASLADAWARLVDRGLPLVERIRGDAASFRVTFVWRPDSPVKTPSIYTPVANVLSGESQLLPLGTTGVWYRSVLLPRGTRGLYAFSSHPTPDPSNGGDWGAYFRSLVPDPHGSIRLEMEKDPDDPDDAAASVSGFSLPGAPAQPWVTPEPSPTWTVESDLLRGRSLPGARRVWMYTPEGFDPRHRSYNLLLALDGVAYRSLVPTPAIVQYLVSRRAIGPTALVFVGNAVGAREVELLHNPGFVKFLTSDVLPWVRRRFHLRSDPEQTVIAGSSLGGLTAAYAALLAPQVFGGVLAQSGAFSWAGTDGMMGSPALMQEYARAPLRSTRFYLSAGSLETVVFPGTQTSLLSGVRHLRDVLIAKGYSVRYEEFRAGHDYFSWSDSMAQGLAHLLRSPAPRGRARR